MNPRICEVCGAQYTPTAYNQRRCKSCVDGGRMLCTRCGAVYLSAAHSGHRHLCEACLSDFRREMAKNRLAPHSPDARKKRRDNIDLAEMRERIRHAQEALSSHPATAANSPDHAHSKIWHLISPTGEHITARNLHAFIAEHPEAFPDAKQAIKKLNNISYTMRNPSGNFRKSYSYHGWRLESLPETPEEVRAAAERRAIIDRKRKK